MFVPVGILAAVSARRWISHRLSVKVNRKGAKVRARQGHFAEKPAEAKK
jgi:hypothetical protein